MSLILKSISQSHEAKAIDALVDHYCIRPPMEEYNLLKKWIAHRANSLPDPRTYLLPSLAGIEDMAVKRVRYILNHKLRGGYESACLLLVACTEAKEIVNQNGNELIRQMDLEFRRFSAFRKTLKDLTKRSRYLQTVGAV